jgi:hypothetical protein
MYFDHGHADFQDLIHGQPHSYLPARVNLDGRYQLQDISSRGCRVRGIEMEVNRLSMNHHVDMLTTFFLIEKQQFVGELAGLPKENGRTNA